LKSYLSKRIALLQLGAQEDDLPLSPELANATETLGPADLAPGESEGDVTDDSDLSFLDNAERSE